jgi:hypothetical protein
MDGAQGESKNRRTRKVDWKKDGMSMSMGKKELGIRETWELEKRSLEKGSRKKSSSQHAWWLACVRFGSFSVI